MIARPTAIVLVTAATCALALLASTLRFRAAVRSHAGAEARLSALAADARDLVSLRARSETVALGQRPSQDTIAQVTAALAQAGLPGARLDDLVQQSDAALPDRGAGQSYRAQTVRFSLDPIKPHALGEFLVAWRAAQSVWTVTQIELTHTGRDDDDAFRAVLHITALYVADSPNSRAEATAQETD